VNCLRCQTLFCFLLLFCCVSSVLVGSSQPLAVRACGGTMSLTTEAEVSRITIGNPTTMVPPNGWCSIEGSAINLEENPVFDFWIRVQGTHTAAFNLAFGSSGIGYPGYEATEDHALNIVGTQVGVKSLGDLSTLPDGTWHHIVFDLGYAVEARTGVQPGKIKRPALSVFDQQASLDLFAGAPPQPVPAIIELRNMVLRPRQANEKYSNDLSFSVACSPIGSAADGSRKYLVGGTLVARRPADSVRLVFLGAKGQLTSQTLGLVQGRKDFALVLTVPDGESDIRARLTAGDSNILAERKISLPRELAYLANATVHVIPNSHNDIAWLDTPEATADWRRDKVIGPAIPLLEKYPDYRYGMETTLFLMEYLNRAPTQAEKVHRLTAEGRLGWGATFNQPYQSLWRGESLVRELYFGRKWMREHLGPDVECVTAWGTDVPSMAMQMPQILAKSGVKYFMLGRFKPGIFNWYSPDGSKVLVGSQGIYGRLAAYLTPYQPLDAALKLPDLLQNWDEYYKQNNIPGHFAITDMTDYLPPTEELIPMVHNWDSEVRQKYGVGLKLKFSTGEEFMKAVTADPTAKFPDLTGEWPDVWAYIHGPTHHDVVTAGREAVWTIASAEKFWTLKHFAAQGKERYPTDTFNQAWLAQIYPDHGFGGYNGEITDTVFLAKEKEAQLLGHALLKSATEWVAEHATPVEKQSLKLVIFNPLSWERSGPAQVEIPAAPGQDPEVVDAAGKPLTIQRLPRPSGGTVRYMVETQNLPPLGYSTFAIRYKPHEEQPVPQEEFKTKTVENRFYRLEFAAGGLRSIFDKELQKEMLNPESFLGGEVYMLDSVGNGAHEFGETQQPSWKNIEKLSQYAPGWRLVESGPLRRGWRIEQPMRQVTVRLDVYLYEQSKRLDFDIELLHWSGERYKEFRMAMPANMPDAEVAYEVPYGVLEVGKDEIAGIPFQGWYSRPARLIHPREIQDWIAASGGGATLMLSSSVALWDYLDSEERKDRVTLLQPILLASRKSCHGLGNWYLQKGDHRYHFSLTSFAGDWRKNPRFGNEINAPMPSVVVAPDAIEPALPSTFSLCRVLQPNYLVTELKVADDQNGIIVRGYEVAGQDTEVTLRFPIDISKANPTSLIEEDLPEPLETSEGQIRFKAGHRSINAQRIVGRWKM